MQDNKKIVHENKSFKLKLLKLEEENKGLKLDCQEFLRLQGKLTKENEFVKQENKKRMDELAVKVFFCFFCFLLRVYPGLRLTIQPQAAAAGIL